eukprot:TRINITY_DN20221_c0_g1_i1.p1 TRINITY_DN20221_c0_g1~~TRINITY_DN20221_c0_g1_i1.p1  ORF type:complete len:419 (+),score=42.60 TRINITY_DN20221_c0_g1_i1:54-1310(+)
MNPGAALLTFACAAALATRCHFALRRARCSLVCTKSKRPKHHDQVLELQPVEKLLLGEVVPTVTYFKGDIPFEYLKERISLIIEANPWLAGRLEDKTRITYPSRLGDREKAHSFFKVLPTPDGVNDETPYENLNKLLGKYADMTEDVGFGLFSVMTFPTDNGFLMLTSICHCLVDGCGFYSIYRMLTPDHDIVSLNPQRLEDKWNPTAYTPKAFPLSKVSLPQYFRIFGKCFFPWFQAKECCATYKVDTTYIDSEKRKFKGEGFVSTNDILSAWWYGQSPERAVAMMAMNMRGRFKDLTADLTANYVGLMVFSTQEERTAAGIRSCLVNYPRTGCPTVFDDPGLLRWLIEPVMLTTNWSSFYAKLNLPGCAETLHVPLLNVEGDICIIFKSSENDLCVTIKRVGSLPTGGPLGEVLQM